MNKTLLAVIFLLAMLTGCAGTANYYTAENSQFIKANYAAASSLVGTSKTRLDKSAPIIVATVVDIDNLEQSSTLGRSVSEHVAAKLANMGYTVKEVKLRGTLFVKSDTGELLLSRELRDISSSHNAQAVVLGTYSDAKEYVYLNLELVNAEGIILSGYNYAIPANSLNRSMLGGK